MTIRRVSHSVIILLIISMMLGAPLRLAATVLSHDAPRMAVKASLTHDGAGHISIPQACHELPADQTCPCNTACDDGCQHCSSMTISLLSSFTSQGEGPAGQPQPGLSTPQIVPHPERLIRPPIALHS